MRTKRIFIFFVLEMVLIFQTAFCHEGQKFHFVVSDAMILNGPVKQEQLYFKNRNKLINIQKRYALMGGDDVGNGGDNLRKKFILESEKILEELNHVLEKYDVDKLKRVLDIKYIKVMEELQICQNNTCIHTPHAVAEGMIFLDKNAWGSSNGILNNKTDYRNLLIYLMVKSVEENISMDEANFHYSELRPLRKKGSYTPYCDMRIISQKVEKIPRALSIHRHKTDVDKAKKIAMDECQNKKLRGCYISDSGYGGFLKWTSYYAQATGYEFISSIKTEKEIRFNKCEKLKQCESLFENAPLGQIKSKDFRILDSLIEENCL